MKKRALLLAAALLAATPALSGPLLHEVLYDAEGADSPRVFTEIAARGGMDLTGWLLVGIDGGSGLVYRSVDLTGAVVPADGLLVIATARAVGAVLAARDFVADVDWQNGPDAVQLWNPMGVVVDALQYGGSSSLGLGEGAPAPDVRSGLSLTRDPRSRDTGDNSTDFTVGDPTPGFGRLRVPEPSASTLLLAGLALLGSSAGLRRRRARAISSRAAG